MLPTHIDYLMKSYKKVGVTANNHRQVHRNNIQWNEAPIAALLIILQHISEVGVSLQELLQFFSDLAVDILSQSSICIKSCLFKCSNIKSEVVKYLLLGQPFQIEYTIADSNANSWA